MLIKQKFYNQLCCKTVIFLCVFLVISNRLLAQNSSDSANANTSFILKNDTLQNSTGTKLFVSQKLIAGKGSGENGWYHSIGFKSDFNLPVLLNQNIETLNNLEYQSDPQKRINDKVTEFLVPGDTLVITKIKKTGNRRFGYWYIAYLKTKQIPFTKFKSDIITSLKLKEILIQSQ